MTILLIMLLFVTGACLGSFVSMASYRLPLAQDIIFRPSYCPACGQSLRTWQLVPLASWCIQGGRCGHCKTNIALRYPLIELCLGFLMVSIGLRYGVTLEAVFMGLLGILLAILIVTDFEHYIIPDSIQIALAVLGIVHAIIYERSFEALCISTLIGFGLGLLLHYGYRYVRKKDGLGWGDVKFLAVVGIWLPVTAFPLFLFLSGLLGIVTGILWQRFQKSALFPFGPALAVSLYILVWFPDIARIGAP